MRRGMIASVAVLSAALVAFAVLAASAGGQSERRGGPAVATVQLVPVNGSGVSGSVRLLDTGRSLTAFGRASGLVATGRYQSLIYDVGSMGPEAGPLACLPNPAAPAPLDADSMGLSTWQPVGSASRVMVASRVGPGHVSLDRIGTLSIRREIQMGPLVRLDLVACGAIEPRGGR